MDPREVFLVQHVHELDDDREDVKLIGVYSTRERAEAAVARARGLPGFSEHPDGFDIDRCEIDKDSWTEGFVTLEPGQE